jgi:hypothetical protein
MTSSSEPLWRQPGSVLAGQGMSGMPVAAPASNAPGFLRQYTAPLWMQVAPPSQNVRDDRVFRNESDFWKSAQRHLLATVRLEGFRLSDWFPRAPGVGFSSRANAIHAEWYADWPTLADMRAHAEKSKLEHLAFMLKFDPHEEYVRKAGLAHRMIEEGGLGTIRLLPRRLDGDDYWFGTAVACGIVDLGIPVAIPASCMERSAASWGDMVNMTGKVRLLVDAGLDVVAEQVHHAPPVLVFVEEITVTKTTRDHLEPRMQIRPVVLLSLDTGDDPKDLSFAFVDRICNREADVSAIEESLSALARKLGGRILTNFDQITRAFADAPLSYQKLLAKKYDEQLLLRLARDGGKLVQLVNNTQINNPHIERFVMAENKTEYTNYGQAGSFGENARTDNANFVQQTAGAVDAVELFNQLAAVRKKMKEQAKADDPGQDAEIGTVSRAQEAAEAGDTSKALELLKTAGKWTLDVAKSVAAKLVADAITGK